MNYSAFASSLSLNLELLALLAFQNSVSHGLGDQLDSADSIVVARDYVVDLVRIAVGINDSYDRDTQLASLCDRVLLLGGSQLRTERPAAPSCP